jgi:hypothetical protein
LLFIAEDEKDVRSFDDKNNPKVVWMLHIFYAT